MILARIKALCENKGISISALERQVGISHGAINSWDTSSPTIKNLTPVADYFGVSIDFLVKGDSNDISQR